MSNRPRERDRRRNNPDTNHEEPANNFAPRVPQNREEPANNFAPRGPRKPLEWKTIHTVKGHSGVQCEITGADSDRGGRLYSVRPGKMQPARDGGEDRVTGFFRPDDLDALLEVVEETRNWISDDRLNQTRANNSQRQLGQV